MSATVKVIEAEKVLQIPLDKVHVSTRNTRQPKPTDSDVISLAQSLKSEGQTTPGIAREFPGKPGHYELGAGARRRVAHGVNKSPTMNIIVREMDDKALDALILVENFQRLDPTPQAEAEVLERMIGEGNTPAEIAAKLGKPESWAVRRMRLLKVIPELRKMWAAGKELEDCSVEMMEYLGSLPDQTQKRLASQETYLVKRSRNRAELEETVNNELLCSLKDAPFDLNDPRFFEKDCGPGCAHDSSKQGELFDVGGKKNCGHCLNPTCFFARLAKAREVLVTEVANGEDLPIVTTYYDTEPVKVDGKMVKPDRLDWQQENQLTFKASEGAKKVIVVQRDGGFKIGYLPKQVAGAGGKPVKSTGAKLKERKAILQGKRWELVRGKIIKSLKETALKDLKGDVLDLVATFGLPWKHDSAWNNTWREFDAIKKEGYNVAYFDASHHSHRTTRVKDRAEALWTGVRSILLERITRCGGNVGEMKVVPDLQRIAPLISFPIEQAKKEADLEIKPPKSWGPVDVHTLEPVKNGKAHPPAESTKIAKPVKKPAGKKPGKKAA